ncbi:hypothetical protein XENORESO_012078 [Xenotaenia resolanae]|uniref:Uncharacterized protein n=1 Tax=Xenotaenia resolanae TaxID=208358 RepID=A0ABV0WEH1_9TELE
MNSGSSCIVQMENSVSGDAWVNGLQVQMLCPGLPMEVVALWCGQASHMAKGHHCTSLKGTLMHKDIGTRFSPHLLCRVVRQHDITFQHENARPHVAHMCMEFWNSFKQRTLKFWTGLHICQTCSQ